MLLRLQSVVIHCSNLERSIAFYRDQLGFPVKRQTPDSAEFHCGPVMLVLRLATQSPDAPPPVPATQQSAPGRAQLSFEVLNLDAFYKEKQGAGVRFALPPTPQDFGTKLAVLLDPDGFPIFVVQEIR